MIQDMRKEAEYQVTDRIEISLQGLDAVVLEFGDYICHETLGTIVSNISHPDMTKEENMDEGGTITLSIKR